MRDPERVAPALAAHGLACAPPGVAAPILSGIALTIAPGERVALTGPNGGGKSTLALTLAGLWAAREGTLERGPGVARVATVLQEPATQITQPTVRDEIGFVALNLGLAPPDAAAWARRVGLAPEPGLETEGARASSGMQRLLEHPPHELSAGQQQLVLLASALAADPDLLIADEALAHVDAAGRRLALAAVSAAAERGLAVLWLTQSAEDEAWADRTLVLARGSLQETLVGQRATATAGLAPLASAYDVAGDGCVVLRVSLLPGAGGGTRLGAGVPRQIAIGPHGVWAVTGANGTGKTSVLEAIAGIEELPEVRVEWAERPTRPSRAPMLAGQYPERSIFEDDVRKEVRYAARRRGRDTPTIDAEAATLFERLGAPRDLMERGTHLLSTGEKRLVGLVAALLAPAAALLLDEPTCGLDPTRRHALAALVREVAACRPVVVASQDREWLCEVQAIEVCLDRALTGETRTIAQIGPKSPSAGKESD